MRVNSNKQGMAAKRSRRVRFIVSWQTYSVGDVIEPNGTRRDWLINSGYCVPAEEAEPEPDRREAEEGFETTTVDPVAETTAMRSSRSKEGRNAGKGRRGKDAVRT